MRGGVPECDTVRITYMGHQSREPLNKSSARPRIRTPAHLLAFGFGAGLLPRAPGTFGTVVGIVVYALIGNLAPVWYGITVLVLFILGVRLCEITAGDLGVADHPAIVWDEIVGFQVTMFMAPPGWGYVLLGFGLFRLFDIVKPYPIKRLEKLPGGWGIMSDDILAGIYAMGVLQGVAWLAM